MDDSEEFVRACTPGLLRTAYLLTGDQHLAEDLVQSALARTHLAWRRIRRRENAPAYTRKVMYHFEDCTEAQAAEILGCSVGTVKSQTSKALKRLRALTGGPLQEVRTR